MIILPPIVDPSALARAEILSNSGVVILAHMVAGKTHTATASHLESHNLLNARIVPQVTFSMPVTTFSEDQCQQMNMAVNKVMLNKLGVH